MDLNMISVKISQQKVFEKEFIVFLNRKNAGLPMRETSGGILLSYGVQCSGPPEASSSSFHYIQSDFVASLFFCNNRDCMCSEGAQYLTIISV